MGSPAAGPTASPADTVQEIALQTEQQPCYE